MSTLPPIFFGAIVLIVGYAIMSYDPTETKTFPADAPSETSTETADDPPDHDMSSVLGQSIDISESFDDSWQRAHDRMIESQRRQMMDQRRRIEDNNYNPAAARERSQRLQHWGPGQIETSPPSGSRSQRGTSRLEIQGSTFQFNGSMTPIATEVSAGAGESLSQTVTIGGPALISEAHINLHDLDGVRLMTDNLRIEPGATIAVSRTSYTYDGIDFVAENGDVLDVADDGSLSIRQGTDPIACDVCGTEENAMVVPADTSAFGDPINPEQLDDHPDDSDSVQTLCPDHLVNQLNA